MTLKLVYVFLRFACVPAGLVLLVLSAGLLLPVGLANPFMFFIKGFMFVLGLLMTAVGTFVIHNVYFSHNAARINPDLGIESWNVTGDEMHNSNTDLAWFRGAFYLAHAVSPYHFGSRDCRLLIKRSSDGRNWQTVATFGGDGDDLRDPKFAVIGERLLLYVLLNRETQPLPYKTCVTTTEDGVNWQSLDGFGHEGWLFWRPKSLDGARWFFPAYWYKFNENALFETTDGIHLQKIALIHHGHYVSEPEIEFMEDGSLLAIHRADYDKGDFHQVIGIPQSSTFISTAAPPYKAWKDTAEDQTTRLDGAVMFRYNNRVYAIGRSHPYHNTVFPRRGAVLGKKRTAIYQVRPQGLLHISDLPSAGDTSYAGVVLKDGYLTASYYTSDIRRDQIWLFGMLEPSQIRMVRINLNLLERWAHAVDPALSQENTI